MFLSEKFSENIKGLIKVSGVIIDGPVFNLHCKFTTLMLLFACVTVSLKQYVSEDGPIQCIVDGFQNDEMKKEHAKAVQTYCWIHSTFTLIPNSTDSNNKHRQEAEYRKIHHNYYQWVCVVFFLQAMGFYIPKWLWKQSEGGLMAHLKGTDVEQLHNKDEVAKKKNDLVNYFTCRLEFQDHRVYATTYWFCEFLCLMNIVAQVFAVDKFLNGNFGSYGFDAFELLTFDAAKYPSDGIFTFPGMTKMDYIFPMQSKCAFYRYGQSGGIYMQDALCVLVLNSYNRYIFLTMWYWFLLLSVLFTFVFFYRIACICIPQVRYFLLKMGTTHFKSETNIPVCDLSLADWWTLYSLKSNINSILFKDIVLELSQKLRTKRNVD